jgi:hypothetical protein
MKNETKGIAPLILAVVVIVVVAVAGVGIYVATRGGGTGGGGGDGTGGNVGSATSLSCDITDTSTSSTFTLKAKDIGLSSMKMRIEGTLAGYDSIYIINGATQTAWMYMDATGWLDMSSTFSSLFSTWSTAFSGYQTDLASWTSGNIVAGTVTISNIQVNPTLADTLFTH